MSTPVVVRLTEDQEAMLEQISEQRGEPPEALATEIVREWLQYEIDFRAAVQEGLDDADAGRLYSVEEVKAYFDAKVSARPDAAE